MVNVARFRAVWTGFQGAPGYSNFHFGPYDGTPATIPPVQGIITTFFSNLTVILPDGLTILLESDTTIIDEQTGQIQYTVPGDPQAAVEGITSGPYSAPSGAAVDWLTATYRNGHRIRGRTFIVPLVGSSYDTQGNLVNVATNALTTAAETMMGATGMKLGVYHRPAFEGDAGEFTTVTSYRIPSRPAVLRSRRD